MSTVHLYVGWSLVIAFAVLAGYGLIARVARRPEVGRPFWGILYYTETVLVIQIVIGLILLFMGRRVGVGFDRHYLYGSVFPIIALIGGRLFTLRRENEDESFPYVPIAFGAFLCFGLTAQALNTAGALPF